MAISPRTYDDHEKLQQALSDLAGQNPTIHITADPSSSQTIISGMDELQLEQVCNRILNEFKIQLDLGGPQVIYLETIRQRAEAEGKYIRHVGGSGNYAHVKLRLEPNPEGSGFEFVDDVKGGVIPPKYIEPVEQGVREAMKGGVLAGYILVDVKVTLFDGSYRDFDSNEMAFKIAGSMALKAAARKATPVLLEPLMAVEVVAREGFMGSIIGDLNSRRGRIESIDAIEFRPGSQMIRATVPMAELLGSHRHWRLPGWLSYSMYLARYEAAPRRDWLGGDDAGVTANKPKRPATGSDSAAARLDPEFD
jgi:elongation factor G